MKRGMLSLTVLYALFFQKSSLHRVSLDVSTLHGSFSGGNFEECVTHKAAVRRKKMASIQRTAVGRKV
jgi:hypothetical protein